MQADPMWSKACAAHEQMGKHVCIDIGRSMSLVARTLSSGIPLESVLHSTAGQPPYGQRPGNQSAAHAHRAARHSPHSALSPHVPAAAAECVACTVYKAERKVGMHVK